MAATIKLRSSDGVIFSLSEPAARLLGTVAEMLNCGILARNDPDPAPLPQVSSAQLAVLVRWAAHHAALDPEDAQAHHITDWDKQLLTSLPAPLLYSMMAAADYLQADRMRPILVDFLAEQVKLAVSSVTPDQVAEETRAKFGLEDTLSAAEKEQIKQENECLIIK